MHAKPPQTSHYTFGVSVHFRAVFRFFTEEAHAEALLAGKVWISTLGVCRKYEEAGRGDPGEGSVIYKSGHIVGNSGDVELETIAERMGIGIRPGSSNVTISNCSAEQMLSDAFVVCTTLAFAPEMLSTTFGPYCIEISDSVEFFKRVTSRLNQLMTLRECGLGPVIYRAREYQGLNPAPGPLGFVKPPDQYEHQREFRMLWLAEENSGISPFLIEVPEIVPLCRRKA